MELIDYVMGLFGRTLADILYLVGDNAPTNISLARKLDTNFIGCYSHRLNLCVIQLLNKFEYILRGVKNLMKKLGSLKKSAILRNASPLRPITRNDTRWSSTFMMLTCYLELKPFIDMNDIDIIPYLPSKGDDYRLKSLLEELKKLESISKKPQEEPGVDLADARALFDDNSKFHPELNYYLKNEEGESICKFVDFENAFVGTILNEQLTEAQNQILTRFRDNETVEVSTTSSS